MILKLSTLLALLATGRESFSQGTLTYDQQSINVIEGGSPWSSTPMGQSFTPSLSSIDFVELMLFDTDASHQNGSTLHVNVRSGSLSGPILGTSASVFTPDNFFGTALFTFSSPVSLTPGTMYFFEPVQSGDNVTSYVTDGSYTGGDETLGGAIRSGRDLWFREGIGSIVPEPSTVPLFVLGTAGFIWNRRKRRFT